MFNLVKSDMYRLVHEKMLWKGLAFLVLVVVCGVYFTVPVTQQAQENVATQDGVSLPNDADLAEGEAQAANEKVLPSRTYSYTYTLGFLGLIVPVLVALLTASDFNTGFVKNVLVGSRNRLVYFRGRLLVIAGMCVTFLLVGIILSDVAYMVAGFTYDSVESIGEFWGWVALSWLKLTAYAYATALIVWATRSKAAGVVFAVIVPSGFLESLLFAGAVGLSRVSPVINDIAKWLPWSTEKLLAAGGASLLTTSNTAVAGLPVAGQVVLVFGGIAVVCAALSLTVCRRKDV